ETVSVRCQVERLPEQLWRGRMLRVPGGLEDDVLERSEPWLPGGVRSEDQRFRVCRIEIGVRTAVRVEDERAVRVMDAHPARPRQVDALEAGRVGDEPVPVRLR